jgi:hypothetical protein
MATGDEGKVLVCGATTRLRRLIIVFFMASGRWTPWSLW